jgi:D-alanine--poly(phosphoribitol) ligase subunit 1
MSHTAPDISSRGDRYTPNLGTAFAEIAAQYGANVAILQDEHPVTYDELDDLSGRIASWLVSSALVPGDVVAIFHDKSSVAYAIMLACLKCGVAYANIDTTSPTRRIAKMLETAAPKILFYGNGHISQVYGLNELQAGNWEAVDYSTAGFMANVAKQEKYQCLRQPCGNIPAYIMFTSGSTGFPKGAVISHQNVLNFIAWGITCIGIDECDVLSNINPMHFDNSVFDFYLSLFSGAALVPIDAEETRNPRLMIKQLEKAGCTVWFSVPSMLVYVLRMRALGEGDLSGLQKVVFGGEGFPKNQLKKLYQLLGQRVELINVYGPTECTCICSMHRVVQSDLADSGLLPLGPMADNFKGIVVDSHLQRVPDGEIGELLIGGPNVGLGYYRDAERTEAAFIQNPTHNAYRDIMYRSGDLVRWDSTNSLYWFVGRKDHQIKRMGYRIELEEIEAAINALDGVDEAACIGLENEIGTQIVACVCSRLPESNLVDQLRRMIPGYMMPNTFKFYEHLPKNQNGKIDRLALKESDST